MIPYHTISLYLAELGPEIDRVDKSEGSSKLLEYYITLINSGSWSTHLILPLLD